VEAKGGVVMQKMYVDWIVWARSNQVQRVSVTHQKTWQDIVTGTLFSSSEEQLKDIRETLYRRVNTIEQLDELLKPSSQKPISKEYSTLPWFSEDGQSQVPFIEAARLFIAFSFLIEKAYTCEDLNRWKMDVWKTFCSEDMNNRQASWYALNRTCRSCLSNPKFDTLLEAVKVKILRGGPYKIRKYYLETDNIKEMRGASILIEWLGEVVAPQLATAKWIPELVIYSGGGNLMALLPGEASDHLATEIEKAYSKYAPTLKNAYILYDTNLKEIACCDEQYIQLIKNTERELSIRKQLKVYNLVENSHPLDKDGYPESFYLSDDKGERIDKITFGEVVPGKTEVCDSCRVRKPRYLLPLGSEKINLCGSCLQKHQVGRKMRTRFMSRYSQIMDKEVEKASMLQAISDDIAVVYADGNNMGGIIQNVRSLEQMAYFSRITSAAAVQACYKALDASGIVSFECIAVGGDDIFMIVPAKKALKFVNNLIECFNEAFRDLSQAFQKMPTTLSAGLVIGKYNAPIRVLTEKADQCLKKAKELIRQDRFNQGSVDFLIYREEYVVDGEIDENPIRTSMRPLTLAMFRTLIDIVEWLKAEKQGKTAIQRLQTAAEQVESEAEFQISYRYQVARSKNWLLNELKTKLADIGYDYDAGVVRQKAERGTPGSASKHSASEITKPITIWKDMLDVWDYIEEEAK
jgi:GGDEF domain-containing protein